MSASLPNFTAPDEYEQALGFLRCQDAVRVRISVANQNVFWQRGFGGAGGSVGRWEPEEELPVGQYSLNERCDAVRFRAAIPAAKVTRQAQVTVSTRTIAELSHA